MNHNIEYRLERVHDNVTEKDHIARRVRAWDIAVNLRGLEDMMPFIEYQSELKEIGQKIREFCEKETGYTIKTYERMLH